MTALIRVLRVPQLWLFLAAVQWLIALLFTRPWQQAVFASVAPFSELRPNLVGLCELALSHSHLLWLLIHTLLANAALGFCFWTIASAGAIKRLASDSSTMKVLQTAFLRFSSVAVTSFYALLLRGFLLFCLSTRPLQAAPVWLQISFFLGAWMICTLALDIARVQIVLNKASGLHPKTLLQSFSLLVHKPKRAFYAILVCLAHLGLLLAMVALASYGLGHSEAIWIVRGLSVLSVGFSLWRISIAMDVALLR